MPVKSVSTTTGEGKPSASSGSALIGQTLNSDSPRQHQEHIALAGFVSSEWYALVHTPVPIPKALKIPKAKEAIEKE